VSAIDADFKADSIEGHVDAQRFKVKLDRVPTHNAHGNRTAPEEIEYAVSLSFPEFSSMTTLARPAWLGREEDIAKQRTASMVLSFAKIDEAKRFRDQHTIFILGMPCNTAPYEERIRPVYCGRCGSLSHREMTCKGDCCQVCTSTEHATHDHPIGTKPKCMNCGQDHEARSRDCSRLAKILGRPPVHSADPAGGATPVNGTKRRKTKKAVEETPRSANTVNASQGFLYKGSLVPDSELTDIGDGIRAPSAEWIARYNEKMAQHFQGPRGDSGELRHHCPESPYPWGDPYPRGNIIDEDQAFGGDWQTPGADPSKYTAKHPRLNQ
jgi:hypothetical protein